MPWVLGLARQASKFFLGRKQDQLFPLLSAGLHQRTLSTLPAAGSLLNAGPRSRSPSTRTGAAVAAPAAAAAAVAAVLGVAGRGPGDWPRVPAGRHMAGLRALQTFGGCATRAPASESFCGPTCCPGREGQRLASVSHRPSTAPPALTPRRMVRFPAIPHRAGLGHTQARVGTTQCGQPLASAAALPTPQRGPSCVTEHSHPA